MKRVRQTVKYLLVIAILLLLYGYYAMVYPTREAVMRDYERGHRYGPSKDILLDYTGANGNGVLLGKVEDHVLSMVSVRPTHWFFLTYTGGEICQIEEPWKAKGLYDYKSGLVYGVADVPDGTVLTCYLNMITENRDDAKQVEVVVQDGFFWTDHYILEAAERNEYVMVWCIVDETGKVLYQQ